MALSPADFLRPTGEFRAEWLPGDATGTIAAYIEAHASSPDEVARPRVYVALYEDALEHADQRAEITGVSDRSVSVSRDPGRSGLRSRLRQRLAFWRRTSGIGGRELGMSF